MTRLFVALRPPPEVRAVLRATMGGIADAHWQTDEQLHLTLAFIGNVDRHGLAAAEDALSRVQQQPFRLQLGFPGSFDAGRADRTSVLWAGVTDGGKLVALAASVRSHLRQAGLPVDERRFAPHITIARFARGGAPRDALRPWLSTTAFPPVEWQVDGFHLEESHTGEGGSSYAPVASYRLGGANL